MSMQFYNNTVVKLTWLLYKLEAKKLSSLKCNKFSNICCGNDVQKLSIFAARWFVVTSSSVFVVTTPNTKWCSEACSGKERRKDVVSEGRLTGIQLVQRIFCSWWICGFIGRWSLEDKVGLEYNSFGYPKGSYIFNLRVHDRDYLSVENRIRLTKFWVHWKYYSVQRKDQTGFEVQETPHLWWWLG
jgi:hypothetical protein